MLSQHQIYIYFRPLQSGKRGQIQKDVNQHIYKAFENEFWYTKRIAGAVLLSTHHCLHKHRILEATWRSLLVVILERRVGRLTPTGQLVPSVK